MASYWTSIITIINTAISPVNINYDQNINKFKKANISAKASPSSGEKPLTCVKECPLQSQKLDIEKAVIHLKDNAKQDSVHSCAKYVRKAIEAGGITLDAKTRPVSAKDYGPYLESSGFKKIDQENYVPQKGDVVVISSFDKKNEAGEIIKQYPHGHIQMYDGQQWISDFKQPNFWPGSNYKESKPDYEIFRTD